ncbi:PAS domain-containing protein [Streptomyces sp. SCSIO 30461]|uniref:PAS domain-containing protein n=1 Tax=Streptomyces sp. SCSIO 30461 TaxID=3118085 RepID=UPI0030D311F8
MDPDFDAAVLDAPFTRPPVGLHVRDRGLRVVRYNSAAPGVRGLDPNALQGRTWRELGLIDAETEERVREVLRTGEPIRDLRYRGRLHGTGDPEGPVLARTRVLGPDRIGCWTLPNEPASAAAARRGKTVWTEQELQGPPRRPGGRGAERP